ncbi:MAG: GNAT family N-acetyltransferase [Pseudomonadota bacterium]
MATKFEIRTERLHLRPPEAPDAEQITEHISPKDVLWHLGRAPYPYQLKDAEGWIARSAKDRAAGTEFAFVITTARDGVIGSTGFNRAVGEIWEIGYWLGQAYWGQGIVTEAASALLDWGRAEFGIQQFVAGHFKDNPASGRVLEKLGFARVGERDMFSKARGGKSPAIRYSLGAPADAALHSGAH